METWLDFERRFRELVPAFQFTRLDSQTGDHGEYWRLAGGHSVVLFGQFEELSRQAGEQLTRVYANRKDKADILNHPDPMIRWYREIKEQPGAYTPSFPGYSEKEDGTRLYLYHGSIQNFVQVSANLCLQLHRTYPLTPPKQPWYQQVWTSKKLPPSLAAVVVLATVIITTGNLNNAVTGLRDFARSMVGLPPKAVIDQTAMRLTSEGKFLRETETIAPGASFYLLRVHPGYEGRPPLNGMAEIPNLGDSPIAIPWLEGTQYVQHMTIENAGQTTLLDAFVVMQVDFVEPDGNGGVSADRPIVVSKQVVIPIPETLRPSDKFEMFVTNPSRLGAVITFPTEVTAQIVGGSASQTLPLPLAYAQLNTPTAILQPSEWQGMPVPDYEYPSTTVDGSAAP